MIVVNFGVNKVLMTVPKGAGKMADAESCDDMVITAVSQRVSIMHLEPFQVLVLAVSISRCLLRRWPPGPLERTAAQWISPWAGSSARQFLCPWVSLASGAQQRRVIACSAHANVISWHPLRHLRRMQRLRGAADDQV